MKYNTLTPGLFRNRWFSVALAIMIAMSTIVLRAYAISGNINPTEIEIDTPSANLYPSSASVADWVKDSNPNTDTPSLVNSIATGIKTSAPDQTGAVANGHWNGVRVVDGLNTGDKDIFLTGGKENDTTTWNVGSGSIGSSKYDISQAYLANNQQKLFFGMERSGNNGTTAFDFEFNQQAPTSTYVPNRQVNDVLFTFEMQGSGGSGSAVPHYFRWNGTSYVEQTPAPSWLVSSINQSDTQAAPWGYVNSNGNWVTGTIPRFEFAEASAVLSQAFPNFNPCSSTAYVQVRTRSSATATSDLKDTTKTFPYQFGGPTAKATLGTSCASSSTTSQFTYDGTASQNSSATTANLGYSWDFTPPAGVTLGGSGVTGPDANGVYHSTQSNGTVNVTLPTNVDSATITVKNTVLEGNSCPNATGNKTVTVYRQLGATATLTAKCNNTFDFSSTATGGKVPYTYAWTFQKNSADDGNGTWGPASGTFSAGSATSASGTFVASVQGRYRAQLTVTDSADTSTDPDVTAKGTCTATATSKEINVYDAVNGTVKLTPSCGSTFDYQSQGSGGKAPYTYDFTIQKNVNNVWTTVSTFQKTDTVAAPGVSDTLDVTDATAFGGTAPGEGTYRALVTITDSQGLVCQKNLTSGSIDVKGALGPQASKNTPDATNVANLTVTLTGSAHNADRLQWQVSTDGGTTWSNIANATSSTLTYDFSGLTAKPVDITLSLGDAAGSYKANLYAAKVRLHVERDRVDSTGAALTKCQDDSPAVDVKKLLAVDP